MSGPLPKKAYWPPAYIFLQSIAVALVAFYLLHGFYSDDAYISLRYVRNLLDGNGLTWNAGEKVEGYTNFLFIIFTALLGKFGLNLVIASRMVNILAFLGTLILLARYLRHFHREHLDASPYAYAYGVAGATSLGLVACSVYLIAWCMGGLESPLFAFFLTLCACNVLRMLDGETNHHLRFYTGIAFALATLTRPEGLIYAGYTLGFLGILWFKTNHAHARHKDILVIAGSSAAIILPCLLWRFSYYGEWLPNTYWAKLYGIPASMIWSRGLLYVFQLLYLPPLLALFAGILCIAAYNLRHVSLPSLYLGLYSFIYIAYTASVGGDHMHYLRFLAPLTPILALLFYHASIDIMEHKEAWFRNLAGALLFFSIFQFGYVSDEEGLSPGALSGLAVAPYISEHWAKGSVIAVNPAGALPYSASDYTYIDMLGLMDKTIARHTLSEKETKQFSGRAIGHFKGDGEYVLSRKPDYIIWGLNWGDDKPYYPSDFGISESPLFKKEYRRVETYVTPPAEIMPQLEALAHKKLPASDAAGPMLNDKNQLRFVYYQRKQ